MKYRESGMPNEQMWETFFDPRKILSLMCIDESIDVLMDIGCGYGTFLIPAAKLVKGSAIGIHIENEMILECKKKVEIQDIKNIELLCGDISSECLKNVLVIYRGSVNYMTLFNILHCEEPQNLLENIYDLISNNGKIGVIHWNYANTPRGPSMEIRPTPKSIITWITKIGFSLLKEVDLPPYHFGLVFTKKMNHI